MQRSATLFESLDARFKGEPPAQPHQLLVASGADLGGDGLDRFGDVLDRGKITIQGGRERGIAAGFRLLESFRRGHPQRFSPFFASPLAASGFATGGGAFRSKPSWYPSTPCDGTASLITLRLSSTQKSSVIFCPCGVVPFTLRWFNSTVLPANSTGSRPFKTTVAVTSACPSPYTGNCCGSLFFHS